MPRHHHRKKKKQHSNHDNHVVPSSVSKPKTTAWSSVQSAGINSIIKIGGVFSLLLSQLPAVNALPTESFKKQAVDFVNSSLTNIVSGWNRTNNTAYCEPPKDKDIETECFAYMSTTLGNIAQAAADVCWKLTGGENTEPNGAHMYKCVKETVETSLPKLLDKYGISAQQLVDSCKFDFEIKLDGYGMSSGWVDKVQVYTQIIGQEITDALCQKMKNELASDVKDTCDPPKDLSGLILAGQIIGGIFAAAFVMAMVKVGYDQYKQWQATSKQEAVPLLTK